jgi:4-hydroxy-3-polyprenylbenzoate decarboxylase
MTGSLASHRRLAMLLGLPPDTHARELVKIGRTILTEGIAPKIVKTGPVKENIVTGDGVDLNEFPVPQWNRIDGGRYVMTYGGVVSKDPDTGVMNVGLYRGMIGKKDTAPFLLVKGGQHWGAHFVKWAARGEPMPIACIIGWDPIMAFLAGSPLPAGVCEWDVMGAYRGEPAELVRCETVDLLVPASAEIVIEGTISDDPATYELEGPFGEFTGYVSDLPTPRPSMKVTCITHRRDPIFVGSLEGTLPGCYSENSVMSSVQRAAIAWNILNGAGIPGILDVYAPPITNGVNIRIQIKKHYQGQPKQIAAALWGNSAAQYRYKHVTVVEEDIDPAQDEQVEWAFAHRVNAGEGGVVIFPGIFGSPIDPSTPLEDRDVAQLGTGLWNRMLIDATRSWRNQRRPEWGNERFPPTVKPAAEDEARVTARWTELGLGEL